MVRSSRFFQTPFTPTSSRTVVCPWSKGCPGNQPIGKGGCFGLAGGRVFLVEVVDGPVLGQQTGFAIAYVVGMREPVIDEEGILVFGGFALFEVIHDLFPVPMTAGLVGATPPGAIVADCEKLVGRFVAVAVLASAHGVVTGPVEDCRQSILSQIGRNLLGVGNMRVHDAARLVRDVPNRASGHHHVARRRADSPTQAPMW